MSDGPSILYTNLGEKKLGEEYLYILRENRRGKPSKYASAIMNKWKAYLDSAEKRDRRVIVMDSLSTD